MTATALALLFVSITQTYRLPPGLLSAVCYTESRFDITAVNPDDGEGDAIGVCQIHLDTARSMGYRGSALRLIDPKTNAKYAGAYLKYQLTRYMGDPLKAIAAYNAGSHKVNKRGITVNRKYVRQVLDAWQARR